MAEQKTIATDACPACGTWVCDDCGTRRHYASRFSRNPQHCSRCSSVNGRMLPARHQRGRDLDHRESHARLLNEGAIPRYVL